MKATPIIKWVGGKTRLLEELRARTPSSFGRYFEPFAGGAALFFDLAPERAVLSDANADLVGMYRAIANAVESVIYRLELHQQAHSAAHYARVRAAFNRRTGIDTERAAAFLYLNRTCFNGLYRVNRAGAFNVPMGDYANPTIVDADKLRAASEVLARAELRCGDYRAAVVDAEAGDFVYFDPPYHDTFTAYTAGSFGPQQQHELATLVTELADRGVHVVLSNSDTPLIRELYGNHRVEQVMCSRPINADGEGRAEVAELMVTARPSAVRLPIAS